jgi:peptide/nickel transport system substrate-binding protein/oligopeptide transport system substrate-binding protein
MIPLGFPGAEDPKIKAIQRFDQKAAMEMLKGTPYEGGKNWPKIVLSMRDEASGPSRWPRRCRRCSSRTST